MKIILCAWCDRAAEHKRRIDGERDNSDACCAWHYAMYFARHKDTDRWHDSYSRAGHRIDRGTAGKRRCDMEAVTR